jgi:hypothetical protein
VAHEALKEAAEHHEQAAKAHHAAAQHHANGNHEAAMSTRSRRKSTPLRHTSIRQTLIISQQRISSLFRQNKTPDRRESVGVSVFGSASLL